MSQQTVIYAVDDDPMVLDIHDSLLKEEFSLVLFNSCEACEAAMAGARPDMILLDIELPGKDGYSFCQQLKDDSAYADIPVLFISTHDTVEERLKGYDLGALDFIVKPFKPDELLRKVRATEQIIASQKNLREQLSMSEQLSTLALASMDEAGLVLQFMSKLIGWGNEVEIAEGLLQLMQRYGLSGAVQVRTGTRTYSLSPQGANLPLEVSVLNHVSTMETIFEFRNRGVYNYANATLMVSNMPLHDPDFCGRIRDNLAIAAAGASSRLEAIAAEEAVLDTVSSIRDTLSFIRQFHQNTRAQTSELVFELDEQLAKAFVNLGLTTGQENLIEALIKEFMDRLTGIIDQSDDIQSSLQSLNDRLSILKVN